MSVLIPGIKMPESCRECFALKYTAINGLAYCGAAGFALAADATDLRSVAFGRRAKMCPLVEVPPHSDLIDRGVLYYKCEEADWYNNADRDEVAEKLLLDAPTVIPADKGGAE